MSTNSHRVPSARAGGTRRPASRPLTGSDRAKRRHRRLALLFLFPALLLLGALVVYPIGFSVVRSFFDASGDRFVGLGNYTEMLKDPATRGALKNNAIWVLVAPALVTGVGLILAVLTEKLKWAAAFKMLIFMPMAISFLAAGITFRLVYEQDPERGVLNAAIVTVHDAFDPASSYPGAHPREGRDLTKEKDGSFATAASTVPGKSVRLGLVGILPKDLPTDAKPAREAATRPDSLSGAVYLDFAPKGGGKPGVIDPGEKGLPGVTVELSRGGDVVGHTTTAADGSFQFSGVSDGQYSVRLPAANFAKPFNGVDWLGPSLITPVIMAAYLWIWAGFAMVLIGAGLAALPRDVMEAARVDGAGEWQIFRRITAPLLAPVLGVVFVTLVINVMKVFDLVYIIAPGPVQQNANVLALQMWLVSFGGGGNQGLGSALGVLLLLLVVPAMAFNIRRFRRSKP
ncbi:ABC transporter permease subunit [Streptomyces sp. NPDC019890]|uniref:ABC transporter permease n=1 Tax=Streptomyces sp. NPDC019890 TaxID=3365064 RepID=UPI00384CD701